MKSANGEGEGDQKENGTGGGEGKPQRKCFYGGAFPQILKTPPKNWERTRQSGDFLPKQFVNVTRQETCDGSMTLFVSFECDSLSEE